MPRKFTYVTAKIETNLRPHLFCWECNSPVIFGRIMNIVTSLVILSLLASGRASRLKLINNTGAKIEVFWNSFEEGRPWVRQSATPIRDDSILSVSSWIRD